jgi:hypothetical protein
MLQEQKKRVEKSLDGQHEEVIKLRERNRHLQESLKQKMNGKSNNGDSDSENGETGNKWSQKYHQLKKKLQEKEAECVVGFRWMLTQNNVFFVC